MKKLEKFLFLGLFFIIGLTACNKKPGKVAAKFYSSLNCDQFADAKAVAIPAIQQQVDVIMHDKEALFNGQRWKYSFGSEMIDQDSARVTVLIKLDDGTEIRQTAKLYHTDGDWIISDVVNTKISYSNKAIRIRQYSEYGNQMLIAPLDIEYITQKTINKHKGKFVLVTGHLCDFIEQKDSLIMIMGDNYEQKPLLKVTLKGKALKSALKDHNQYMGIDSMVKSPLGDTFTALGLLKKSNSPYMEINNPQNIKIGPFARLEKP